MRERADRADYMAPADGYIGAMAAGWQPGIELANVAGARAAGNQQDEHTRPTQPATTPVFWATLHFSAIRCSQSSS